MSSIPTSPPPRGASLSFSVLSDVASALLVATPILTALVVTSLLSCDICDIRGLPCALEVGPDASFVLEASPFSWCLKILQLVIF